MSAQILFGLPWAEYTQGGYIGSSGLSEWGTVGLEAWSRENLEEGYTDSKSSKYMAGGTALDQRLTGDPHGKPIVVLPAEYPEMDKKGVATGEMKKWTGNANYCKEWLAKHSNCEIITAEQDEEIKVAEPRAREAIGILEAQAGCKAQFQVTLRGELSGLKIQTRPDMMIGNTFPDLKYINGTDFAAFDRKFIDSRYFLQAGLAFGLAREAGISGAETSFLLVESGTRFPRSRVALVPARVATMAWDKVRRICDEIAAVRDSKLGFVDVIQFSDIVLPGWAETKIAA